MLKSPDSESLDPRPRTRADCEIGPRPCPWVGCRHHAATDVSAAGTLRLRSVPPSATCTLDLAERGGMTLTEIATVFGVSRERIRQIELAAMRRVRRKLGMT